MNLSMTKQKKWNSFGRRLRERVKERERERERERDPNLNLNLNPKHLQLSESFYDEANKIEQFWSKS
jgi:hypothetical protein